jgi:hypothetical protein
MASYTLDFALRESPSGTKYWKKKRSGALRIWVFSSGSSHARIGSLLPFRSYGEGEGETYYETGYGRDMERVTE